MPVEFFCGVNTFFKIKKSPLSKCHRLLYKNLAEADPNAGQQQQLAQAVPYQSTFYTGHLPAPAGEVGQFINRTVSTAGLKERAEACFNCQLWPCETWCGGCAKGAAMKQGE